MIDVESADKNIREEETENSQDISSEAQFDPKGKPLDGDGEAKEADPGKEQADDPGADSGSADAGDDAKVKKHGDKRAAHKSEKDAAEELKKLIAEKTERLQRTMAEFDNFRKRTEKEKDARFGMGERNVIEKILPVIDNFERGFAGLDDASMEDPFVKGMDQVYKQLKGILEDMGVKEIPAKGEKFNPDLHNAVMHVEDENFGENEVVEVFSKGYLYKGTVVRFSMVKVAN